MKKGQKMNEQQKSNVQKGIKKYFENNSAWNKGLKFSKYDEPACKRLRKDKKYYLNELRNNALRREKYRYDDKRIEDIKERTEFYNQKTGKGRPPKEWSKEDIEYLRENYMKPRLEVCAKLGRSWSSVGHKVGRLGLIKYNKWIRK